MAKIERSGMDGSRREVVVSDDLVWPNSLAIDYQRHRLYWTDPALQRIDTALLDGTQRTVNTSVSSSSSPSS